MLLVAVFVIYREDAKPSASKPLVSNLYGTVSSTLKNLGLPDNPRSTVNRTRNEHIVWDITKVMIQLGTDQIPLEDFKVLIEKHPKEMQLQIECSIDFYFQSPLVASYFKFHLGFIKQK